MFEKMAILIGIVVLSFSVQALSGFGSMVISITLGQYSCRRWLQAKNR